MVFGFQSNSRRPSPGSIIDRWLQRITPHPDTFVAGVRHPAGSADQQRWRYSRVWVDPYRENGVVTVRFGKDAVRVVLDDDPWRSETETPRPRAGLEVLSGRSADTQEPVRLAVPAGSLHRFGIVSL